MHNAESFRIATSQFEPDPLICATERDIPAIAKSFKSPENTAPLCDDRQIP
jgi:hypothetical protein